ncbi:MAG: glycosyltransferase family 39 protein [Candidatus Alcyoniella australis]|nr:glycosyltransferase family 39 protein [Candidatus Alcyoniella australis]
MPKRLGTATQARTLLMLMALCLAAHQALDLLRRPYGFEPESFRLSALLVLGSMVLAAVLALRGIERERTSLFQKLLERPTRNAKILVAICFALGALAAALAPQWNDERFNLEAAQVLIDHGLGQYLANYGSLSDWLSPHHPPLLATIYGLLFKLSGSSLFAGRLLGLAFFCAAQWMTFALGHELYDERSGLIAAACLPCFPLVIFEAPTALFDMPFLFFFLAALLYFKRTLDRGGYGNAITAALAIGLGGLTRYNMLFIYPILLAMLVRYGKPGAWRDRRVWLAALGPVLVAAPWIAYLALTEVGRMQVQRLASYLLVAFVPEGGPQYVREALLPVLPVHLGMFMVPPLVYGCWISVRQARSNTERRRATSLIFWWIAILLVLTGLTIPHVRYLLPAFPALALAMARGLLNLGPHAGSVYLLALFCSLSSALVYDLLSAFGLVYVFY